MITILKNSDLGLETLNEFVVGSWICVVDPTTEEIERLQTLGVPQDFITNPLDLDERARTERDDNCTLIVLRIPLNQGPTADIPYTTIPFGIILTEKYLITVCKRSNEILTEFTSGRVKNLSTSKRNRFILRLMYLTATKYLNYLREINKTVDILEDKLTASMRNKEVLDILRYQKTLVLFTTALKANELMLERLQRSQLFRQYPDDEDLLEDAITENQQAIEMTNISNTILSSMMDAFASIISNNLNGVMKFLASITIVLSIPTIVTSYYGMNVDLPFQQHDLAALFVILISIVICIGVVIIFVKKDWF